MKYEVKDNNELDVLNYISKQKCTSLKDYISTNFDTKVDYCFCVVAKYIIDDGILYAVYEKNS